MSQSRIAEIYKYGQSIWLDYIRRDLFTTGQLKQWIDAGEISGMTSNPTIFDKAISDSSFYDDSLKDQLSKNADIELIDLYESFAIEDIQSAADTLRPIFDKTNGLDGYVSLEVSPKLAYETQATIDEAKRLFATVDRPNLMIKIPATAEGLPAIREVIRAGLNINVTLMFSLQDYKDVADAYLSGLEDRVKDGNEISDIASVASFFVSRVDAAVDKLLPEGSPLRGKIAIANSKIAYEEFQKTFASDRFKTLEEKGARIQRILWGSTGTKDPSYSDVLYIEELIGPNSVNTVPLATLDAFRDHGKAAETVTQGFEEAHAHVRQLPSMSINLDEILEQLKSAGVDSFSKSFDSLMDTLSKKRAELLATI